MFFVSYGKKKIVIRVVLIHIVIVLFLMWGGPNIASDQNKQLKIKDVVVIREKPKVIAKQPVVQKEKVRKEKILNETSIQKKKTIVSNANSLIKQMQSSFDKLEEKEKVFKPLSIPKKVVSLKIEKDNKNEIVATKEDGYEALLIEELQSQLHFPDLGEVKVKIFIDQYGKITKLDILSSKNEKNKKYIKNTLPQLVFPWFNHYCSNNETKEIVILFKNE